MARDATDAGRAWVEALRVADRSALLTPTPPDPVASSVRPILIYGLEDVPLTRHIDTP
jgi:hypothetical protein